MTEAMIEHPLACPYCGESITMLLDLSVADQSYVEDCEVCCSPITLRVRVEDGEVVTFDVSQDL